MLFGSIIPTKTSPEYDEIRTQLDLIPKYIDVDAELQKTIISEGKYKGETFIHIFTTDLDYCRWVSEPIEHNYLPDFKRWLKGRIAILKDTVYCCDYVLERLSH
jgi:hypothetical protein